MRTKSKIMLLASLFVAAGASAENIYSAVYNECARKAGRMNNMVVYSCSEKASQKAKEDINKYYKSIYKRLLELNQEDAKKFEESQKAWLIYRNLHCELAGSYIGSPMYSSCPMQLNSIRAMELKELDN